MVVAPWVIWAILALTVATAAYSYSAARKAQKRAGMEAKDLDVTLADEGASFKWIFGSPNVRGNITWKGNESSYPVKARGKK